MPHEKRAWASWNYHGGLRSDRPQLTYWMNLLEGLKPRHLFWSRSTPMMKLRQVLTSVTYHHRYLMQRLLPLSGDGVHCAEEEPITAGLTGVMVFTRMGFGAPNGLFGR